MLVTGGAGAIGSILVEALLARGDEVAVLDSFHDFYPRAQKERNLARARGERGFAGVFEGDIRDGEFVAKTFESFAPRAVVHLAARAGVRPSLEDPVTYTDVNLLGTSVVLNAATRGGVERFVFASSSSVYGERPRGEFTEDLAADRPLAPYGATKRGGELLCYAAQANSGVGVTCLRFFNAYGPRMRPDLAIHKFAVLMLAGPTDSGVRRRQLRARLHVRRGHRRRHRARARPGARLRGLQRGSGQAGDGERHHRGARARAGRPRGASDAARAARRHPAHLGLDRARDAPSSATRRRSTSTRASRASSPGCASPPDARDSAARDGWRSCTWLACSRSRRCPGAASPGGG